MTKRRASMGGTSGDGQSGRKPSEQSRATREVRARESARESQVIGSHRDTGGREGATGGAGRKRERDVR